MFLVLKVLKASLAEFAAELSSQFRRITFLFAE